MADDLYVLRDYQGQALELLRGTLKTLEVPRRVLLQAATGSGKTVMAAHVIKSCQEKGFRCLVLARGRELVRQFEEKLKALGVLHGIMMAGRGFWKEASVQIASKDTFYSWVLKRGLEGLPDYELVVIDEAHGSISPSWLKILKRYERATVIGLTATPCRADGKGLGALYGAMVCAAPTSRLIALGCLVPTRVFAPYRPDLRKLKRDGNGDYDRRDAAKRLDRPQLVGDIVQHWLELGKGRPTVVFACTVEHSLHIRDEFVKAGVRAEHIDGETPTDERDGVVDRITAGAVEVVCNVGVWTQGVDVPCLSCCVLARPTRSLGLFLQMVGRVRRPHGDKKDALLIDHAGACYRLVMPDEDIAWTLDERTKIEDAVKKAKKAAGEGEPAHCPRCHAVWARGPRCPECGYQPQKKGKGKEWVDGKLVEVTDAAPRDPEASRKERLRYWQYCQAVMVSKGRTGAAAGCMYKAKYGAWPGDAGHEVPNLPAAGAWKQPAAVLFPNFVKGK